MSINHHVSDDLLVSYGAGSLAEGWSLAIAVHLSLCPDCRKRLVAVEAIGGDMLEAMPGEAVNESSWQAVRARLDRTHKATPAPGAIVAGSVFPRPLRDYVGGDLEAVSWHALGKGPSQMRLSTADRQTQVRLLRIPAGQPVPEHTHGGRELTIVLAGSFSDAAGSFARGDIEDADPSITHQPVAGPEADCICLAVTDAPLRFSSWIVRMVQPILGI